MFHGRKKIKDLYNVIKVFLIPPEACFEGNEFNTSLNFSRPAETMMSTLSSQVCFGSG